MIEGVVVKKLMRHVDERGYLMEILRRDDTLFQQFGQAYVSACFPGMVKAWHCHRLQTDHFCCLSGNLKVGLYDDREDSSTSGETQTIVIGMLNPALVVIPPLVWHGFMAVGGETAIVLNLPTELYNHQQPDELRREAFDPDIPFDWKKEGW
jgi:dTDP-4-dehydrorhamnose 3,5-epimerase